jgi:hypothetical protein
MRIKASLTVIASVGVLTVAPLSAQSPEAENAHLRNDCRLAAQVLRSGYPAPRRDWAFETIPRCDESGPVVLAELWRTAPPAEPAALAQLYRATRQFNDRRLIDAMIFILRHEQAPETTRVSAGTLLFSYAVPGTYLDADELLGGSESPALRRLSHDTRARETRARLGDLRPELKNVLGSVADAEPASRVGRAAATMLKYLGYLSP